MKFKITKKKIIVSVIVLLIAGGGFWYWKQNQGPKTVMVEQVNVENVQVRESVSASGLVVSEKSSNLRFLAGGTIAQINVNEGDIVQPNQILATLDSSSESQSARAARDARDIALRNRDLFLEQTIDKEAVGGEDAYDIKVRTLSEEVSKAEANYRSLLAGLADLSIKAPFTGTIVDITKVEGEAASATETVIKIADLDQLYFEVNLDQEDFGLVSLEDPVQIELDAYPDQIFHGQVFGLPKYIDPDDTTALKVKIRFTADGPILLGMAGDGTIITSQTSDKVQAVPFDAVFTKEDDRHYLWVLNNGTLNKKYVEIGLAGDAYTEVKDNLEGQTVVIPSDADVEVEEGDKGQTAKQ